MAYICWVVSFHIKLNHCQTLFQHTLPYQQVHLHCSFLTLSFRDPCYFYCQKARQTVHVSYSQAWSKEHGVPGLDRVPRTPASLPTTSLQRLAKGWGPALMNITEQYWCREDLSSARVQAPWCFKWCVGTTPVGSSLQPDTYSFKVKLGKWLLFWKHYKAHTKNIRLNNNNSKFGPMNHFDQHYNLAAPDCSVTVPLHYQLSL